MVSATMGKLIPASFQRLKVELPYDPTFLYSLFPQNSEEILKQIHVCTCSLTKYYLIAKTGKH